MSNINKVTGSTGTNISLSNQTVTQRTPSDEKVETCFKTRSNQLMIIESPLERKIYTSDGETETESHLDNLPDDLIYLIIIELIRMRSYNPSILGRVNKHLKSIVEDSITLNPFLTALSETMNMTQETLKGALETIKLPFNYSTSKAIGSSSVEDGLLFKLRLIQGAQEGTIQPQKTLKEVEQTIGSEAPTKILFENILQGDATAFRTLGSIQQMNHLDFTKIMKELMQYKDQKIFRLISSIVLQKRLNQIETIVDDNKKSMALFNTFPTMLKIDMIAATERIAMAIPDTDINKKSISLYDTFVAWHKINRIADATRVAIAIPDKGLRKRAAEHLSQTGNTTEAEEVTNTISKPKESPKPPPPLPIDPELKRSITLGKEALQQMRSNPAEAEKIANTIPEIGTRARVLRKISKSLLKTNISEAERVANTIPIPFDQSEALRKVSEAFLQAANAAKKVGDINEEVRNIAEAQRVTDRIPDKFDKKIAQNEVDAAKQGLYKEKKKLR